MQETGLKGKKHSALRKMLPILIGFSWGLALVLASGSQSNWYFESSQAAGQSVVVEHTYGFPVAYIVHHGYWNFSAWPAYTEYVEFNMGNLIGGWVGLSVTITLGILLYQDVDKLILKRSSARAKPTGHPLSHGPPPPYPFYPPIGPGPSPGPSGLSRDHTVRASSHANGRVHAVEYAVLAVREKLRFGFWDRNSITHLISPTLLSSLLSSHSLTLPHSVRQTQTNKRTDENDDEVFMLRIQSSRATWR